MNIPIIFLIIQISHLHSAEFSHITTRLSHVYDHFGSAQHFLRAAAEVSGKKWCAGAGFFGNRWRSTHGGSHIQENKPWGNCDKFGVAGYSTKQKLNLGLVTAIETRP